MSIAKRLAILIFLALGGLLSVGLFGLYETNKIDESVVFANTNTIPSIRKIGAIEVAFLRLRVAALSLVFISNTDEQKAAQEKIVTTHRAELDQSLRDYEKLLTDDKDRQFLEMSKKLVADYYGVVSIAFELAKNNRIEEAKVQTGKSRDITIQLMKNLQDHSQYNSDLADNEGKKAAAAYKEGVIADIVIIVLIVALVAGLGFTLQRHVAGSLQQMLEAMNRVEKDLDLTARIPVTSKDEIGQTIIAFNRLTERLQSSLRQVMDQTGAVNAAASRVACASQQISTSSAHQSESASSMAASIEEMTVSITHVADRANDASRLSTTSGQRAQEGASIISDTVNDINSIATTVDQAAQQINQLEQYSERINSVVSVIKEVADQTNLLALNAAIEAARAGEQGRGFAVVADEVRKLAERTTASTQEIASTITEMQEGAKLAVQGIQAVVEKVGAGVEQAEKANTAIQDIGGSSRETVTMVSEISEAIQEQSIASTSIAQQVEVIAQMSEENNAASQSTAETANELEGLVAEMQRIVNQYKV